MNSSNPDFLALGHGKTGPWMDLVNSEEWDKLGTLTDHLNSPAWIPYFLRHWRFAEPSHKAAPLAKLKLLRAAVRKSCQAVSAGKSVPTSALRILNQVFKVYGRRQLFQRQNGLQVEFVPADSGWDWILAEIAHSFAETLRGSESARIKICRNSDCRWVFYDCTKGKTRCWCSGKSCGNRERVRRARARGKS